MKPCLSCPYRRSVPVGVWAPEEYENLQAQDAQPFGAVFGCHLGDGTMCRGWLADQKRRGLPCLTLRVRLLHDDAVGKAVEAVDENDPDLYASIEEMAAANVGQPFPEHDAKARRLAAMRGKRG